MQKSFRSAIKYAVGGLINRDDNTQKFLSVRALDNVTLDLKYGDRVALIGHNGAGKSTLLRVCAGIFHPHAGMVKASGIISSVFGHPPGLDFEDTGYENIIICGLFLGLTKKEIQDKLEDIERFSELGDYLKLPVRTYSTGMVIRLGFAIAMSIEPEILILDEQLGASDFHFVERAKRKLDDLIKRSSILMFASHSEMLVKDLCNKAILLNNGKIVMSGSVDSVFQAYRSEFDSN